MDRDRARAAFDEYISSYDPTDVKIAIKIGHTLRVADLCERIGASEGLSGEELDLAWICGLLHDIGRFEQIRQFGTFSDAKSVPHAAFGARLLFEEGLIRKFVETPEHDELLRTAVATHSGLALPHGLDERTRRFCDILRDADKIDILAVNAAHSPEEIFGATERQMRESPLSPAVIEAFYAHETVRRDAREHPADYLLGFVCFVWGVVYPESLRIMRDQGHLLRLMDYEFTNPATRDKFARMGQHLREWLDRQLA